MSLLIPKMSLLVGYSVGGYRYCVGDLFWIWLGTLLEAIGIVLETHFRFGFQMGLLLRQPADFFLSISINRSAISMTMRHKT